MSRVAKKEIHIPAGVTINRDGQTLQIKGAKGSLNYDIHPDVVMSQENNTLTFTMKPSKKSRGMQLAGTTRARINNIIEGITNGFEAKLTLVGVGYRAQAQGSKLNLSLGFSHPVEYTLPAGITVETPSQTEIVIKGIDIVKVGQVAADIRDFRPPEPYKGKGVRYDKGKGVKPNGEIIILKETKKK